MASAKACRAFQAVAHCCVQKRKEAPEAEEEGEPKEKKQKLLEYLKDKLSRIENLSSPADLNEQGDMFEALEEIHNLADEAYAEIEREEEEFQAFDCTSCGAKVTEEPQEGRRKIAKLCEKCDRCHVCGDGFVPNPLLQGDRERGADHCRICRSGWREERIAQLAKMSWNLPSRVLLQRLQEDKKIDDVPTSPSYAPPEEGAGAGAGSGSGAGVEEKWVTITFRRFLPLPGSAKLCATVSGTASEKLLSHRNTMDTSVIKKLYPECKDIKTPFYFIFTDQKKELNWNIPLGDIPKGVVLLGKPHEWGDSTFCLKTEFGPKQGCPCVKCEPAAYA